jgi:demethylmenaquinone methyltransferase/2-methoxy-6-polyprenyl-1,4-benzoquinol methylase
MTHESGTLPAEGVRSMFDRIAPVYDLMNRVMTVGLDQRWRRLTVRSVVVPGERVLDACCGTGDLAVAARKAGANVVGLDFSERMLERARHKDPEIEWIQGDLLELPFEDASFDAATVGFGVRNVADLEQGLAELRRVLRPGGRVGILEITRPRGLLRYFYRLWFEVLIPLAGKILPGGKAYTYLPASVRRFPGPEELAALMASHGERTLTTLEDVRRLPGLDSYLEEIEARLTTAVAAYDGRAAEVGADALAAGGKRLRPLLAFLCAPPGEPPPIAAGVAVELVHMATLVHDDVIDGATVRRGKQAAWAAHGADAARATGDYLFARAFAELAAEGDVKEVAVLADASLCLARGEAMQRRQRNDPDTPVEAYLERCALKTGKLFEAACSLGSGGTLGRFGLKLGIAFQIADDILDCSGDTIETGKVAGTDLREGTPTLPLLLAARDDDAVRAALAGGPVEGALLRVAATGALERSRQVALDYAREARESLNGGAHREELESLADAVVNRKR